MKPAANISRRIFAICLAVAAAAAALLPLTWAQVLELKTVDARFQFRYWLNDRWGCPKTGDRVVLAAIDPKSVDPAYSDFSDRWGMGGWLTRDFWSHAVLNLAGYYKPRVAAYDILFIPYRSQPRKALEGGAGLAEVERNVREKRESLEKLALGSDFPRLRLLELVDQSGNESFAEAFQAVADLRDRGASVPDFVMAYYTTRSEVDSSPAWAAGAEADREKMACLKRRAIPAACVRNLPTDFPFFDNAQLPFDSLAGGPVDLGFINVGRDPDGNIRRIPLLQAFRDPRGGEPVFVPSIALDACLRDTGVELGAVSGDGAGESGIEVVLGEKIRIWKGGRRLEIPVDRWGRLFLNFEGKVNDFKPVSYADLNRCGPIGLRGAARGDRSEAELALAETIRKHVEGKILLVGVTFTGATDVGPCAIDSNAPYSLIHLTAIDNILRGRYLAPSGPMASSLIILALTLLVGVVNGKGAARINAAVSILVVAAYLLTTVMFACLGLAMLPVILPALSMVIAFGAVSLFRYGVEFRGRLAVREKFSTMVSPELLSYMEEHPESFALSGERREVTIFFSDIAGFTTISEKLQPEQLVEIVNAYLTPMTDVILRHKGYLNKYLGDGIMAVWGAPYPALEHARLACAAALEQQKVVEKLRTRFQERYGLELEVRMGINSGIVDAGNMGSSKRFEYTVMGDAVNLAARLEPANKDYGTRILLGEATAKAAGGDFVVRLLDRIVLQGKSEPVGVYELVGARDEVSATCLESLACFERGLGAYWNRNWRQAIAEFEKAAQLHPGDGPAQQFLERAKAFQAQPPPENWSGQYVRTSK